MSGPFSNSSWMFFPGKVLAFLIWKRLSFFCSFGFQFSFSRYSFLLIHISKWEFKIPCNYSRVNGICYRDIERGNLYKVSSHNNRNVHINRSRSRQEIPRYVMIPSQIREMEPFTAWLQCDGGELLDQGTGANEERSVPLL